MSSGRRDFRATLGKPGTEALSRFSFTVLERIDRGAKCADERTLLIVPLVPGILAEEPRNQLVVWHRRILRVLLLELVHKLRNRNRDSGSTHERPPESLLESART